MPDPKPHFSLIVCTVGRSQALERLFESLQKQGEDDFEVILVDQNPEGYLDTLLQTRAKDLNLRVVRCEKGLSRARNAGLRVARGDIVAFPDDDCWYPAGLLADVRSWFSEHPAIDVLTCPTRDADGAFSNGTFLPTSRNVRRGHVLYAGNSNGLFFRARAVAVTGFFDETLGAGSGTPFGAGEESDYLFRALAAGCNIRFERNLFTHHDQVERVLDEAGLERAAFYARGFGRILRLHGFSLAYLLARSARSLVAAGLALATGRLALARMKWIWVCASLAGYRAAVPHTTRA